ncbi:MAG: GntR family transcriptional regulator [Pseudomonadota bacterium]|nr:GntR family transcriptional regulator [Pseudomonadota bacterium]
MEPAPRDQLFPAIAPETVAMPLYQAVKRSLLHAIETGRCAPGKTLPSEGEIATAMGVSIGTLRRAVDELVAEQILVRRQGLGTFVASHGPDRSLSQFFRIERADGLREAPHVDLLSFERSRLPEEPAKALHLRTGETVFQVENRLSLQGSPVIYDKLFLPSTLFKGLTEKRWRERSGTLYQFYQSEFGITVVRAGERARAVSADQQAARVLDLSVGQPVMQVRRTALGFGDRPVEHRISIINTAGHDYVNLLSRPAAKNA